MSTIATPETPANGLKNNGSTPSSDDEGVAANRSSSSSSDEAPANTTKGFRKDGEPDYKPRKHNMSTSVDRDAIRKAYDDVRSDSTETEWAVFKFDGNSLGLTASGKEFPQFKELFGNEDRGFGYIRIKTGDEMSKRAKFIFVTWVGPSVSVMKKAKMSTDKALMKDIIQNFSVELQLENHGEFSHDHFKLEVDKAAGARYGTGVRDL